MKKIIFTLSLCISFFGTLIAQNIWAPIDIPCTLLGATPDGSIFSYCNNIRPRRCEVLRSQDEGETWQMMMRVVQDSLSDNESRWSCQFAISDSGRVFLLVQHIPSLIVTVFTSDNEGETWQQIDEIECGFINGISAPTNDMIVFWDGYGNYRWTIDGGQNWNNTSYTLPHDGSGLPHTVCHVLVNASGDIYAHYRFYSNGDSAILHFNISNGSWQPVAAGTGTMPFVVRDMVFDSEGNVVVCGFGSDNQYYFANGYCLVEGQTLASSDNGAVYRLSYTDDLHVFLSFSMDHGSHFIDVGEALPISQYPSEWFHDGDLYTGQDHHLYFHGNGQYWRSVPTAEEMPFLDPLGIVFFDDASKLHYCITGNNTAEVIRDAYQGAFVIPETVSYMGTTYTVVGIGQSFRWLPGVTFIDIPETVTCIEDGAFQQCSGLDSIHLPNSLVSIGRLAFEGCNHLKSIYIPNAVTSIGEEAFMCPNLEAVHLPNSLEVIESNLFFDTKLQSVVLPESLLEIKEGAFNRTELSEIVIPRNVEYIGEWAFNDCSNLSRIELGQSVNTIASNAFSKNTNIPNENITVICHNPIPAQCSSTSFPSSQYQELLIVPCGCEEAYRSAWAECWQSGNIEEDCGFDGTEWYYEILNDDGSVCYQYLQCTGDTTINSERPKVIVRTNQIYDKEGHTEVTHEYIFESDGIVYWWNKDLHEFTVLYNLDAKVGDEWEIKVGTESIIMHVDTVEQYEYEGRAFKMLHVSDQDDVFSGDIVCGIGHLTSFFPEKLMNHSKEYHVEGIRCFWQDGNLVFKYGEGACDEIYEQYHNGVDDALIVEKYKIHPNPTDGLIVVETQDLASLQGQTTEYRITNILGQTLLTGTSLQPNLTIDVSSLPSGLYFLTIGEQSLKFVVR